MMFSRLHFWKDEAGTTLVESLVAMTLLSVIMLGGFQFFVGGRGRIDTDTVRRLAVIQAEKRLELANRFSYAILADSLNETLEAVDLGGINGWRTTTVTAIDDPIDGQAGADEDSNPDDYKQIVTTVAWSGNGSRQISLSTCISADYHQ